MKFILPGRSILSKDGWKALTSSIGGHKDASVVAEQRLAKALSQRNDARAQRDKTRLQRDDLREEVSELRLRVAELQERRKSNDDAGHALSDTIDVELAPDDPARHAMLLKRELTAESARVQELERNLDRVLRRSAEIESRLSRTRAMLSVAIDDGDVDLHALKTELELGQIGGGGAQSHDDCRPALGSSVGSVTESPAATMLETADGEVSDAVAGARQALGSSTLVAAAPDERGRATAASGDMIARLPEPAVLNGERLTPVRARKVAKDRQLQIDGFVADGEYARIQALKDIHKGRRAFIVGNGPSLDHQDLSKLDREITFVTNWFANHEGFDQIKPSYYAISSHEMFGGWARQNPMLNRGFVEKLTRHNHKPEMFFSYRFRESLSKDAALDGYERKFLVFDRPRFLADEAGGLEFDLAQPMHDGYTVLLTFCVPLAVHMGVTEIYMVGCDHVAQQNAGARSHFYEPIEHVAGSAKAEGIGRIGSGNGPLFRVYELARDDCAARGVKMFNATAGGELEVLPRVGYDEVLSVRRAGA